MEIRTGRPDLLRVSLQEVTKGRVSPSDPSPAESDPLFLFATLCFSQEDNKGLEEGS